MKDPNEILKKNKCREQNVFKYGAAHVRLAALFFHFSMYDLQTAFDYYTSRNYELTVFYHGEEEKELIEAIISYYNMDGVETENVESKIKNLYYFQFRIKL